MPFVGRLGELLGEQGGSVAGFGPAICIAAGMIAWVHRDPFDRLLAATVLHHNLPLISADAVFVASSLASGDTGAAEASPGLFNYSEYCRPICPPIRGILMIDQPEKTDLLIDRLKAVAH